MEKIINIDIVDIKDLTEKFDNNKVSKDLINYIIDETLNYKKYDNIKININSYLNEKIDILKLIKEGIKYQYIQSLNTHFHNSLIQIIYLIIGAFALFLSSILEGEIFQEVILIGGWVLIWTLSEMILFSDVKERKKRKALRKLLNSKIELNKNKKVLE